MSRSFPFNIPTLSLLWIVVPALAVGGTELTAQQELVSQECHCTIDSDGNRDCSCVTSEGPQVRIGIGLDPNQSAEHDALGVLVSNVLGDSPAEEAGLREGDVITSLQGRSLLLALDEEAESGFDPDRSIPVQRLRVIARALEPGDEIEVGYERNGESRVSVLVAETIPSRTIRFELDGTSEQAERLRERVGGIGPRMREMFREGIAPTRERGDGRREIRILRRRGGGEEMGRFSDDKIHVWRGIGEGDGIGDEREIVLEGLGRGGRRALFISGGSPNSDGLELVELQPAVAEYFGTDGGILVTDVDGGSSLGLEPGDVILLIGERVADSPEKVQRILRSYDPGEEITFHVMRKHQEISVEGHRDR